MNDDHLSRLLASLRHERMDRAGDDRTRRRLEEAWGRRAGRRTLRGRLRALAPAAATLVLVLALGLTVMHAPGDSPLYAMRIAVEDAAIALHPDPEDRARYLFALLDQRQAEAARLEAVGNALAAARVRSVERRTLADLEALLPQEPGPSLPPSPVPTPTTAAAITPAPTATPAPTLAPAPTATPAPSPAATSAVGGPLPTPTRTPALTVRPTTPAPTPTPAPLVVFVHGTVKNPDGSANTGACISLSAGGTCLTRASNGGFAFAKELRVGQTLTVYAFTASDTGAITTKAVVSAQVKGGALELGTITLQPR